MAKVELISNIFHYYYTALALSDSGYLGHYITGPCALESDAWMKNYGRLFQRLHAERLLKGIPPQYVKRIWLAEVVQKGVKKFGGSGEQSNWVHNEIFARKAAWLMQDCDAVHFVHSVGVEAALKAKRNGAKVICDMREEHPQFQQDILSEEAKMLGVDFTVPGTSYRHRVLKELELADAVFCPSAYAKRTFVEQGMAEDRIVVCPYGVDTGSFVRPADAGSDKFTVLFLGNICMRKGVHYLLEGFKKANLKNARLILAGPVDPQFKPVLQKFAGLFEEVGRVAHSEVHLWYRKAHVFAIPSLADAYPLVVLEAMAAGLPVIVSRNTGSAQIITEGNEGYVVPVRDADAIAGKLVFLSENRDTCAAMGLAAAAKIKTLNWQNYQDACAAFYKQMFKQ